MKYIFAIMVIFVLIFVVGFSLSDAAHQSDIDELNEANYCGKAKVVEIDRPKGTTIDLVYCSDHTVKWR